LLCVQLKTPDDGQRYCPKHAEFYPKNKFEELVHLVGVVIRMVMMMMLMIMMAILAIKINIYFLYQYNITRGPSGFYNGGAMCVV